MARSDSVEVGDAPPALSKRGNQWSRVEFLHGREASFDPETNPHGVVRLDNSENVSPLIPLHDGQQTVESSLLGHT